MKIIKYRVVPGCKSYAYEDFETLEAAIERANNRNKLRIDTTNSSDAETRVLNGHNCKILKVTEIVEPLSIYDKNEL